MGRSSGGFKRKNTEKTDTEKENDKKIQHLTNRLQYGMNRVVATCGCRRRAQLVYLGDPGAMSSALLEFFGKCCDNCSRPYYIEEGEYAWELSILLRTLNWFNGQYPFLYALDCLRDIKSSRMRTVPAVGGLNQLKGQGKSRLVSWWVSFVYGPVADAEFIEPDPVDNSILRVSDTGRAWLANHPVTDEKKDMTGFLAFANHGMRAKKRHRSHRKITTLQKRMLEEAQSEVDRLGLLHCDDLSFYIIPVTDLQELIFFECQPNVFEIEYNWLNSPFMDDHAAIKTELALVLANLFEKYKPRFCCRLISRASGVQEVCGKPAKNQLRDEWFCGSQRYGCYHIAENKAKQAPVKRQVVSSKSHGKFTYSLLDCTFYGITVMEESRAKDVLL